MRKYHIPGDVDEIAALIEKKIPNAQYRRVLKLRFCDALTYQEIADDTSVKVNSVRQVGWIINKCVPLLTKETK